jgi:Flp pilus assembly protein TadB
MVAVSGGLNPAFGNLVKAVAGRKQQPGSWLMQCARWFAEPARQAAWQRLVKNADLTPARRPLIFQQWLPAALLGAVVLLLVVAGVVDVAAIRIIAALLAGLVLAVGAAVLVGSWYIRRQRKRMRQWIENRLPPISPESRSQ